MIISQNTLIYFQQLLHDIHNIFHLFRILFNSGSYSVSWNSRFFFHKMFHKIHDFFQWSFRNFFSPFFCKILIVLSWLFCKILDLFLQCFMKFPMFLQGHFTKYHIFSPWSIWLIHGFFFLWSFHGTPNFFPWPFHEIFIFFSDIILGISWFLCLIVSQNSHFIFFQADFRDLLMKLLESFHVNINEFCNQLMDFAIFF